MNYFLHGSRLSFLSNIRFMIVAPVYFSHCLLKRCIDPKLSDNYTLRFIILISFSLMTWISLPLLYLLRMKYMQDNAHSFFPIIAYLTFRLVELHSIKTNSPISLKSNIDSPTTTFTPLSWYRVFVNWFQYTFLTLPLKSEFN